MKPFFKDLFEYNHYYNQKLIAVLNENPKTASEKAIKLMSHILNAHEIWNVRITAGQKSPDTWEVQKLEALKELDKKNFEVSLRILETFEFSQMVNYTTKAGKPFTNSVHHILFHVINHSNYHRAQIATEFKQNGVEPIMTDYIYYKMI